MGTALGNRWVLMSQVSYTTLLTLGERIVGWMQNE